MEKKNEIIANLNYLANNISDLKAILRLLMQEGIITGNERDEILAEKTETCKCEGLLLLIIRKDYETVRDRFLTILKVTGNKHCIDKINGIEPKQKSETLYPTLPTKYCAENDENWKLVNSFIKRNNYVEEMRIKLKPSTDKKVIPGKIVITGLGGIGKSTLAVHFATKNEEYYNHIIWIDCRTPIESFHNLLNQLKYFKKRTQEKYLSPENKAEEIYKALADLKCLWIFDDVDSYEAIRQLLPLSKRFPNFHTIITSRNCRKWGSPTGKGQIAQIEPKCFTEEEAFQFFQISLRTDKKHNNFHLRELSKLLGGLPLAFHIASACISESSDSVPEYIAKLRSEATNILQEHHDDYPKSIQDTISLSLAQLKEKFPDFSNLFTELMKVFGFLSSSQVKLRFLESIFKNDKNLNASLDILARYSLVNERGIYWDVHKLVQNVMQCNFIDTDRKVLKKILNCEGFLESKLIPYSWFAKRYPEEISTYAAILKALLRDVELSDLVNERRFEDAVVLAKENYHFYLRKTNEYNLGVCLFKNEQMDFSGDKFERLLNNLVTEKDANAADVHLEIINASDTLNKYECALWLHYMRENRITTSPNASLDLTLSKFTALQTIKIIGNYIPVDVALLKNIQNIRLQNAYIIYTGEDLTPKSHIQSLLLYGCSFVNANGESISDVALSKFPFQMKQLDIIGLNSLLPIHIDLSVLPISIERTEIQDTVIAASNDCGSHDSSMSSISLKDIQNPFGVSKFLSNYPKINNVELHGHNIQLSYIPQSVQHMTLRNIVCINENANSQQIPTNLRSLKILDNNTISELEKLGTSITTDDLVVEFASSPTKQQQESVIKLVDKSKRAFFNGFCMAADGPLLQKYGIYDTSKNYYKITDGKHGEAIEEYEFIDNISSIGQNRPITVGENNNHTQKRTLRKTKKPPVHHFDGKSSCENFVGRVCEMEKIKKFNEECVQKKILGCMAITGNEGIGKTQLTKRYANFHNKDAKMWIDCTDDDKMELSFRKEAKKLNISTKGSDGKDKPLDILMADCYKKIDSKKYLVVLDNTNTHGNKTLKLFADQASKQLDYVHKPFVITTSREYSEEFYSGISHLNLTLDGLSKDDALELFCNYLNEDFNDMDEKCQEIINVLFEIKTYPPQSIYHAANNIIDNTEICGSPLADELFNFLLEIKNEVYCTLETNSDFGQDPVLMMNIIAFLTEGKISMDFPIQIYKQIKNTNSSSSQLFQPLIACSMIKEIPEHEICVNSKLQEAIRKDLENQGKLNDTLDTLATAVGNIMAADIDLEDMAYVKMIWQHLIYSTELVTKYESWPKELFNFIQKSIGDKEAFQFCCDSEKALCSLNHENSIILDLKRCKGISLTALGDYDDSLNVLNEVCETEKSKKADFLETLEAIAFGHLKLKNYDKAMELFQSVLDGIKKRKKWKPADMLRLNHRIALTLIGKEKYHEALASLKKVKHSQEYISGSEHPAVLETEHAIATILLKRRLYQEALNMFSDILDTWERLPNPHGPSICMTKYSIALTYHSMNKNEEAFRIAKDVLNDRVEIIGTGHPDTIASKGLVEEIERQLHKC